MKAKHLYLVIILVTLFLSGCKNDIEIKEFEMKNMQVLKDTFESEVLYKKDEENVYWNGDLIENADSKTFEGIPGPNDETPQDLTDDDFYFFKDRNAFYMSSGPFGGNGILHRYEMENVKDLMLPEGDLTLFGYVNDGSSVYYLSNEGRAEKIIEADLPTFRQVDGGYGYMKDENHVYFHGKILEGADVKTFEHVSYVYKDNKHVYYYGLVLEGADPETFQAVRYEGGGFCYYKDKNHVYWKVQPNPKRPTIKMVAGANPETFECMDGDNEYDGIDKNYLYKDGVIKKPLDL